MSDWVNRKLSSLVQIKHGFAFRGEFFADNGPGPILVTPGNFAVGGGFKKSGPKIYLGPVPEGFELAAGDLIVTMTDLSKGGDTLGYPALVPSGSVYLHNQRIGLVQITDAKSIDKAFLFYALRTANYRHHVLSGASGSTVRHTSPSRICEYILALPPLKEQRSIADCLAALDDKIAVNQRIAETSSDLALSLFSEERWSSRTSLSSLCSVRKVQVRPSTLNVPAVAHHSLPAFDNGQVPDICSPDKILSAKFLVDQPGVLLSKLNPDIPRVWRIEPKVNVPALASTEFLVLVPNPTITTAELWAVARQAEFLSRLAARVTGTSKSHQRVRPNEVLASDVVDPRATNEATRQQVSSLVERAEQAREERIALAQLRDVLLPKLISGELRIKDAERLVSDAV